MDTHIQSKRTKTIPILLLVLCLLSLYFLVSSYINIEKATAFQTIFKNSTLLNDTRKNIGNERGLTALYLGSNKKRFLTPLYRQRKISDNTIVLLKEQMIADKQYHIPQIMQLIDREKQSTNQAFHTLKENLSQLPVFRQYIYKKIAFEKIFFDAYTKKLTTPALHSTYMMQNNPYDTEISKLITSLIAIYTAQEYADLERGLVSYYLMKKIPMPSKEIARWDTFQNQANTYPLSQIETIPLQDTYKNTFNPTDIHTLTKELATASLAIQERLNTGRYTIDAQDWFTLQTHKITLLSKAQLFLSHQLWERNKHYIQKQTLILGLSALALLLCFILTFFRYRKREKPTDTTIQNIEHILNDTIDKIKKDGQSTHSDFQSIKHLNFTTKEGLNELEYFLNMLVQKNHSNETSLLPDAENKNPIPIEEIHEEETHSIIRGKGSTKEPNITLSKKILIAKKFKLEQKLFMKVIENLGFDYDTLIDLTKVEEACQTNQYDIIFTDTYLVTDSFLNKYPNITIVTSIKSKEDIKRAIIQKRS